MNDSEHAMLSARIPAQLHDRLARSAQSHDRSLSAEAREAIRMYVSEEPGGGSSFSPPAPAAPPGAPEETAGKVEAPGGRAGSTT